MKLIIDIPDSDYKFIRDMTFMHTGGRMTAKSLQQNVINAIKFGKPCNQNSVSWLYCKNLNEINEAIKDNENEDYYDITADNIISITYDTNHARYVVFWKGV